MWVCKKCGNRLRALITYQYRKEVELDVCGHSCGEKVVSRSLDDKVKADYYCESCNRTWDNDTDIEQIGKWVVKTVDEINN